MKVLGRFGLFDLMLSSKMDPRFLLILLTIVGLQPSCEGQHRGREKVEFNESVRTEVKLGLHIVPVELNGKRYRFLFDTGAPTSISMEVQNSLDFKVVDRGSIVDSDKNKIRVKYVRVDSMFIGGVRFGNIRAFVGDFQANPTLACLELDGIIGSNMMQVCNWQIDYVGQEIKLSSSAFLKDEKYSVDFRHDKQYDIMVNMKMGKAKVSNMKIDYGNNSSISVPDEVFEVLTEEEIIESAFAEVGYSQGGLGGSPVPMNRYHGYLDSLSMGNLLSTNLKIKTGKSGLIGRDFLSRYIVAINWSEMKLRFKPHDTWDDSRKTFGYSIGLNSQGVPVLFGVVKGSSANSNNLEAGMKVLKIDSIDFTSGHSYCDYIDYLNSKRDKFSIEVESDKGEKRQVILNKLLLNSN